MALGPILSKPRVRSFLTYDLEWNPSDLRLRLFGVYDGERYRYYTSVEAFLVNELTDKNKGRIFYAHAGGSYDVQFILNALTEAQSQGRFSEYSLEACFSGSSAVLVTLQRGRCKWTFADSFFLLRDSLANIGKWIGVEKLDNQVIFDESAGSFNELVTYNERDCVVLYKAIDALQEQLLRLGGQLQATLAACAMALFRRVFLKHDIQTSAALNLLFAGAYFASRVEVYRREAKEANYYDVNSSFPYSMSKPQPGSLRGISDSLPTSSGKLYIAKCDVEVKDCYLPPLPYRSPDSRILFPTGKWSGMFDCEDIELLLETGLGSISNIEQVWYFEPFSELADYVATLYEFKRDADRRLAEGDEGAAFARQVFKLLLNALYGKFGERTTKRKILINPADTHCPHTPRHAEDSCIRMLIPGVWEVSEEVEIVHAHLPISIHTTASSRAILYRPMADCSEIYYCDTDSISCAPSDTLDTPHDQRCANPATCPGCLLGGMKLEKRIEECEWLAPKLYSYKDSKSGKRYVKSKGFSRLSYEDFVKLKEGKEIEFQRMARIRETMRFGDLSPRDMKISKRLIGAKPKRCPIGGGRDTRPWTIGELAA